MINLEKKKLEVTQKTAKQIKYYRTLGGFSQKSLAIATGLNPTYLGHIERSLKCPTIDTLYKISFALNIPLSLLLDFDGEKLDDHNERAVEKLKQIMSSLSPKEVEEIMGILEKIIKFKREG